jgi:hypothetical protein
MVSIRELHLARNGRPPLPFALAQQKNPPHDYCFARGSYLTEDPKTVTRMLWHGFPVLRLLLAWAAAAWIFHRLFRRIDRATRDTSAGGAIS